MTQNRELKPGWTEATPPHLRCGIGVCPAVYRTPSGSYVIVGRTLGPDETASALPNRVGAGETAIEIAADFIELLARPT